VAEVVEIAVKFGNLNTTLLIEMLDEACSIVPSSLQSACDQIINEEAEPLVKCLVTGQSSEACCALVGLCGSTNPSPPPSPRRIKSASPTTSSPTSSTTGPTTSNTTTTSGGQNTCQVCETIAEAVEIAVKFGNVNTTLLIEILDKACAILPSTLQSLCDQIINDEAEPLVKCLITGQSSESCCALVGLCGSTNPTPSPTPSPPGPKVDFDLTPLRQVQAALRLIQGRN
jgi:hypothetical protein